jgi:hypothetical protein
VFRTKISTQADNLSTIQHDKNHKTIDNNALKC